MADFFSFKLHSAASDEWYEHGCWIAIQWHDEPARHASPHDGPAAPSPWSGRHAAFSQWHSTSKLLAFHLCSLDSLTCAEGCTVLCVLLLFHISYIKHDTWYPTVQHAFWCWPPILKSSCLHTESCEHVLPGPVALICTCSCSFIHKPATLVVASKTSLSLLVCGTYMLAYLLAVTQQWTVAKLSSWSLQMPGMQQMRPVQQMQKQP